MPETEGPTFVILISSCGGLLILTLLLVWRVLLRLKRMERQLDHLSKRPEPAQAPTQAETSPGGAFEAFLAEDPERRHLPKGEQFSAYRQWRHEKGMNWSNS